MNTKNNIRSQSTHEMIKSAFLELSLHKETDKISVREICEAAQINRSSFYLHFQDVYGLIEELDRDIKERLKAIMAQAMDAENTSIKEVFLKLFGFLKENKSFFLATYKSRRVSMYDLDLTKDEPFHSKIVAAGKLFGFENEREIHYHSLFFTAGVSAVMEAWLLGGCVESPEYLSELICKEYSKTSHQIDNFNTAHIDGDTGGISAPT